ncbi:MAG: hypothetical protein ABJI69_13980 [Balneola sp.]
MKRQELFKNFIGAFVGVVIYELVFDITDPFQNYWANYVNDIALIGICIFVGIVLVGFLMKKYIGDSSEEKS